MKRFALAAVESPRGSMAVCRWQRGNYFSNSRRANERRFNLSIISWSSLPFLFPFSLSHILLPPPLSLSLSLRSNGSSYRSRTNSPRRFNPLTKIAVYEQNEIVFFTVGGLNSLFAFQSRFSTCSYSPGWNRSRKWLSLDSYHIYVTFAEVSKFLTN